jgi:hypothetical protein
MRLNNCQPHSLYMGKSKRAKWINLRTCFGVFLRLFMAVTPSKFKMTILILLLLNMTIFFGQDLAPAMYIIFMNTPWYHCSTLIT